MQAQRQGEIPYGDKQIRYKHYMYAKNLKDGDLHDVTGYQLWISRHSRDFRNKNKLDRFDSLETKGLQDDFTEYLRMCSEKERLNIK